MEDVVPWDYNGADKLFQPVDIVAVSNICNMALTCLWDAGVKPSVPPDT